MATIKELKEQIEIEKKKLEKDKERKDLEKELFNLKHETKIKALKNIGGNLKHMGKNAFAMVKKATKEKPNKKKGKEKKHYDPFENINFRAFG